jgi:segregation and condensation protein B
VSEPDSEPAAEPGSEPEPEPDPEHLRLLEAILFASAEALPERMLARRLPEGADVKGLLAELERRYRGRGVNLVRAGDSWAIRTAPDLASKLAREIKVARKLSRAAVETLSIIAYHQPVTRAEIEEIRGVGMSKGTLDILLEAGWIRPRGRRQSPGRPLTWGTTDSFLDHFGLSSLDDLPGIEEIKAAGLLDPGPARAIYGLPGTLSPAEAEAAGADGEQALPPEPADEEAAVEPLDPADEAAKPESPAGG